MSRESRIALGIGCLGLGFGLVLSGVEILWTIGLGLLGAGIVQFIRLPKDNVLQFRKTPPLNHPSGTTTPGRMRRCSTKRQ